MGDCELDPDFWVPIYGFEERYKISKNGSIFSVMSNRVLKPHGLRYLYVRLRKNNENYTYNVGRLVLGHFGKTSSLRPFCDHINHNTHDNRIENLRAVTCQINNLNRRGTGVIKRGNRYIVRRKCSSKETYISCDSEDEANHTSEKVRDKFVEKAFEHLRFKELRDGVNYSINSRWIDLHRNNIPRCPSLYIPREPDQYSNNRSPSYI